MSTRISKPKKTTPQARPKNRTAVFGGAAAVLAAVAIAIWAGGKMLLPEPDTSQQPSAPQTSKTQSAHEQQPDEATKPGTRLFSETMLDEPEPEPEEQTEQKASEEKDLNVPFELEQIAYALSRVEVDENGDVVVNETAQTVLEQAFLDARQTIDEQQLEELKAMIETGLEGQAGAQAVEIAEKFYRYSNAFREVSDTLAVRGDPQSLRNDYEQVTRLRRTHLGEDLAKELYGKEEQLTRYTLEVMELQANKDLSAEERSKRQQELASRYKDVMPGENGNNQEGSAQVTN
ncbi:MAG: lipase secretion chaperone [Marinobacter sp.]